MTAAEVIAALGLRPHPEGGWYTETFRDSATDARGRARSTAIYYLLDGNQSSARHRIDATEVWHHYCGAPLELVVETTRGAAITLLGGDLGAGQRPQAVVPAGAWQSARPLGGWVLVGCTVAPGFELSGFELAERA